MPDLERFTVKTKLLAAAAMAAVTSLCIAQAGGSGTGAGASTGATPATPATPATRGTPAVPATPATPATAATPSEHGMSRAHDRSDMESARKACANLAGAEARQACVRQHSDDADTGSMGQGAQQGRAGMSNRESDTSVSPGTGSGGGEDGRSGGGVGFPKGTSPNTDSGSTSRGNSGSRGF